LSHGRLEQVYGSKTSQETMRQCTSSRFHINPSLDSHARLLT